MRSKTSIHRLGRTYWTCYQQEEFLFIAIIQIDKNPQNHSILLLLGTGLLCEYQDYSGEYVKNIFHIF